MEKQCKKVRTARISLRNFLAFLCKKIIVALKQVKLIFIFSPTRNLFAVKKWSPITAKSEHFFSLPALYITHCFYCIAVEAGFYRDVVKCLTVDPATREFRRIWGMRISNPHSVVGVMATCGVRAGALSCKNRTPFIVRLCSR